MSQPKSDSGSESNHVTAVLHEGSSAQNLMDYLGHQMVPVPGFTPPSVREDQLCPVPASCSVEDENQYRSAGVLLQALANEARAWSQQLPPDYQPAIVAILHGGLQVQVRTLAQISFDGIRIEGLMGDSPCSMLAHQNTVQLVCYAEHVGDDEDFVKRPIGFIWPDKEETI